MFHAMYGNVVFSTMYLFLVSRVGEVYLENVPFLEMLDCGNKKSINLA
jgi:hypothetical protein